MANTAKVSLSCVTTYSYIIFLCAKCLGLLLFLHSLNDMLSEASIRGLSTLNGDIYEKKRKHKGTTDQLHIRLNLESVPGMLETRKQKWKKRN